MCSVFYRGSDFLGLLAVLFDGYTHLPTCLVDVNLKEAQTGYILHCSTLVFIRYLVLGVN